MKTNTRPPRPRLCKLGSTIGMLLLTGTLALAVPALAQPGQGRTPGGAGPVGDLLDRGTLDESQMQLVVRTAYQVLARSAAASGADLSLQVQYLTTVSAADFSSVHWLDLVDMPDGPLVDVTREMRKLRAPGAETSEVEQVVYVPRWRSQEKEGLKSSWVWRSST